MRVNGNGHVSVGDTRGRSSAGSRMPITCFDHGHVAVPVRVHRSRPRLSITLTTTITRTDSAWPARLPTSARRRPSTSSCGRSSTSSPSSTPRGCAPRSSAPRAQGASAALDTEGHRVVDTHLARVEATEERGERATILRELADDARGSAATPSARCVVRLAAFAEAPTSADLDPLLRLARVTERWSELPLDAMTALVDITDDASRAPAVASIATAWQQLGRGYRAADCLERVLADRPDRRARARGARAVLPRERRVAGADRSARPARGPRRATTRARRAVPRARADLRARARRRHRRARRLPRGRSARARSPRGARRASRGSTVARRRHRRRRAGDARAARARDRASRARARATCSLRAAEIARAIDYDKAQALFERALRRRSRTRPGGRRPRALLRDRGELARRSMLLVDGRRAPGAGAERSRWLATPPTSASRSATPIARSAVSRRAHRRSDEPQGRARARRAVLGHRLARRARADPRRAVPHDRGAGPAARLSARSAARSRASSATTPARATRWRARSSSIRTIGDAPRARRSAVRRPGLARRARLIEGAARGHEDLLAARSRVELHLPRGALRARARRQRRRRSARGGHARARARSPRRAAAARRARHATTRSRSRRTSSRSRTSHRPRRRRTRFTALGDRYAELGDRATAREMYREALVHRPADHLLLTKFLGLVADEGDWSYSLDLVQRLIDTEKDRRSARATATSPR